MNRIRFQLKLENLFRFQLKPEFFLAAILTILGVSCNSKKPPAEPSGLSDRSVLIQRGKSIYQTQCIACHHSDPQKPGAIGPEVSGAPKELLELRILKGEYPPGYTPKRNTHTMVPLPHLKNEIEAIHAYLNP